MSTTTDTLEDCIWSVEAHHFDNIAVKCVFKCKNPGYKTYSKLHKHYLDVHRICLHRVARLDPDNEDEFRRQVTSFFAPLAGGMVTSQGPRRGRATSHTTQPPAASPPPQIGGRIHPRDHQMPSNTTFRPAPASLGQGSLSSSPVRYPVPIPVGGQGQNRSPGRRPLVLDELGPSRSPAVYPVTRHQPYPQSRPQQQGFHMSHSPIHGQAKGKNREILPTAMSYGRLTPNTPSQGNWLELTIPTTNPYNGTFVESPPHPNTTARYSRSQQELTETSISSQWALEPQYPMDIAVPGSIARESFNSARESGCPTPTNHTCPPRPQHQQLQAIITGPSDPGIYLPTPPTGTNSLPGVSPRLPPPDRPNRSPWGMSQKQRLESLAPPTARIPSPHYSAQRLVSHPYPRPVNGFTTSQLARQARENRQQGLPTEMGTVNETFMSNALPPEEMQTTEVDIRHPAPDRLEQDYFGDVYPGLLGETAILSDYRQNHLVSPSTELVPPRIRAPSRHVVLQLTEPTPITHSAYPRASVTVLRDQAKSRASGRVIENQSFDEPPTTRRGPGFPEQCRNLQGQILSDPVVSCPIERPRTVNEPTPPTPMAQEPNREPTPIQRHNSGGCHPTKVVNEEVEAPRKAAYVQGPFLDISWEGWGLIRTSGGIYLPETFNPFPHVFEDLTDQPQPS